MQVADFNLSQFGIDTWHLWALRDTWLCAALQVADFNLSRIMDESQRNSSLAAMNPRQA